MLAKKALFHAMQTSSQRFDSLRKVFEGFCTSLTEAIAHNNCPVKGLSVESHTTDGNYFDVLFVGERWRFTLSALSDGGGLSSGVVTLYRMSALPEQRAVEGCSFTFNGRGDSDVTPSDNDGDCVPMDTTTGALYLTLNCIHHVLFPSERSGT
ncbi:MAG: hypothetical protein NDI91_19590 [Sulfuritalea sp.]|nr:hypothetical protein [Sulfuritalea sp.]